MVRYREIVENKKILSENEIMMALTLVYYKFEDKVTITRFDPNTNEVDILTHEHITLRETKKLMPFILNYADTPQIKCNGLNLTKLVNLPKYNDGMLSCQGNQLTTLENIPNGIGDLYAYDNQLTTLDNLPDSLTWLDCASNPLKTLSGLEKCKKIQMLRITYDPNLPLLRIMSLPSQQTVVRFYDKEENSTDQDKEVEDILCNHLKEYSNVKERIYKCQYALIKAGFKGNAKW